MVQNFSELLMYDDSITPLELQGISLHLVPLGDEVCSFVYRSKADIVHLFINDNLAPQTRLDVLTHELRYIHTAMESNQHIISSVRVV